MAVSLCVGLHDLARQTNDGIAADADFARGYANFRRGMVYGEAPDFETAIATLKATAGLLKKEQA